MIDPDLRRIVDDMAARGFALPDPLSVPGLRALLDVALPGPTIEVERVADVRFGGAAGTIPARLYHPRPGATLPAIVFLHGGGWVLGSVETHDRLARTLARDSGCAVISVEYRRAPEHPYPAPLEDCLAAASAVPGFAKAFGIDPTRYAVAGDSAGGNLAAAVALKLRGQANAPAAQLLLYPVTDRNFGTRSYQEADSAGMLTPDMMRFFWNAYVGGSKPDAFAAPLRSAHLTGVAPAIIVLARGDPLFDEGLAYAVRLCEAGVPTDLHVFAGAIHGFASFLGMAPIADQAIQLAARAVARALA